MAYNLEPRTIKENLLGLIGKNPHAEPRPANTREECFLADIAENGGGGLPPYTSADKGKGLFLADDAEHTETVVIVPAQEITNDGENPAVLTNVTITVDDVVVGETVNCEISKDGVVKDLVLTGISQGGVTGYFYADGETAETQFLFYNNEWLFTTTEMTGNIIVYVYKESVPVVPKWEEANGALIIHPQGEVQYNGNNGWLVGVDKTFLDVKSCFDANNPVRMIRPIFVQIGTFSTSAPYYDYENEGPKLFVLPAIGIGNAIIYEVGTGYWGYGLIISNGTFYIAASFTAK